MKQRKDGRYCKEMNINGKRVSFYGKSEREILNKIRTYKEKEEKGKTFKEVADEWERVHYEKIEFQTALRYKSLTAHAVEYFDTTYIKKITSKDVEQFLDKYVALGYSTKSLKDQLSVLSMIFKYACIHQYIENTPTMYVSAPKGKKSVRRQALTKEEVKIVENSIGCTLGLFAFFLLYTGLRKGEALALTYNDIDYEKKLIYVNKTLYFEGNTPQIKNSAKTEAGERCVIIPDKLLKVLPKGKKNEIVFDVDGEYYKNSLFIRHFNKYKKETGLNITPHQLRHSFATILFEAEIDVKTAQTLMGHSDIATTQNIYTHIRQNQIEKASQNLNKYLNDNLTV